MFAFSPGNTKLGCEVGMVRAALEQDCDFSVLPFVNSDCSSAEIPRFAPSRLGFFQSVQLHRYLPFIFVREH